MPDTPLPGQQAPHLEVDLVGGGTFRLADADPDNFTMVVFYRGLHCPVCRGYNRQLHRSIDDFAAVGVDVVAVSMDPEDRATETVEEWGLDDLRVGYGLSEDTAREWGLFLSTAIKDAEPDRFSEPGLFLVRPDGELYYAAVNSMPWGRPDLAEVVKSIGFVLGEDYPSRGRAS